MRTKPVIICIVGESASGKSRISNYVGEKFNIPLITSITDRAMRPKEIEDKEVGRPCNHLFFTPEEFDEIQPEDMIAFTKYGANRYCCRKQDVHQVNTYVINEGGMQQLKSEHSDEYNIISVRVACNEQERFRRIEADGEDAEARIARDEGQFNLPLCAFSFTIKTDVDVKNVEHLTDYIFRNIAVELAGMNPETFNEDVEF